jgi:ribonuclease P protein component
VKRTFRLTRSTDFERVRRLGKSYPHPLIVLVMARNESDQVRVAVSAGRSVGGAVERNRAKRILRASIEDFVPLLSGGWDIILLARKPLTKAGFWKTRSAMEALLKRAGLVNTIRGSNESGLSQ